MKEQTLRKLEEEESSELRLNLITGSTWLKFKDGYEDDLDEPSGVFHLENLPTIIERNIQRKKYEIKTKNPHKVSVLLKTHLNHSLL